MDGMGERIPDEPSELAMSYSARMGAHEARIDVPEEHLMQLTRWERHVLNQTARRQGYTAHRDDYPSKLWLTRP